MIIVDGVVSSIYANSIETYNGIGGAIVTSLLSGTEDNYQIEAVPNASLGYEFIQWTDGTTANPRVVTPNNISPDGYYNAIFAKTTDIHLPNGHVEIEVINQTNPNMLVYSLTARPNVCGVFMEWMESESITNPLIYTEKDGTRTPIFAISETGSIHTEYQQGNGGVVSLEPIPYSCNQYQLIATPNADYEFLYWLDGNSDNPRIITCHFDT